MRFTRHPEAVWEDDGATVFATAPTIGEVVILDGASALIWHALDGATTPQIAAEVSHITGAPQAEILPHLTPFLADLVTRRLVVAHA
ncbi:PqqD family protein [Tessaracoccus sp. Z1128]